MYKTLVHSLITTVAFCFQISVFCLIPREKLMIYLLVKKFKKLSLKMKLFYCLLVCFIVYSYGWERSDLNKYGPVHMTLYSGLIKCEQNRSLNLDVSGIDVYFYDLQNNDVLTFPINKAARGILSNENLDKKKNFVIYVGGFMSSIKNKNEIDIGNVFKNVPNTYLIILDHSKYTSLRGSSIKSYSRSVTYVHYIGKALGQLLAKLRKAGVSAKNIHCSGHSLGGQIVGRAGEEFLKVTGEKIKRISALDPAGPCFTDSSIENQVRSGLAEYVEVYHCNSGAFGSASVLGDVDFFLNKNGEMQPNCYTPWLPGLVGTTRAAVCSHSSCVDVWIESIKHPKQLTAWKCDSYEKFRQGMCWIRDKTIAGFWNPGEATGVYYVSTEGSGLKF